MILIDTNVLSEVLKPQPSQAVVQWLNVHFAEAAISSVTIFELGAGLTSLDAGRRRDALESAIQRMVRRFGPRVYPFDAASAERAVRLLRVARAQGLALHQIPLKLADLQIAGIAAAYELDLATRNTGDFENLGLTLINPWSD
jgi:toxin FitB